MILVYVTIYWLILSDIFTSIWCLGQNNALYRLVSIWLGWQGFCHDEIGHCKLDAFHNKCFAVKQKNQNQADLPLRLMPVLQLLLHSQMLKYQDTPDQGQFGLTSGWGACLAPHITVPLPGSGHTCQPCVLTTKFTNIASIQLSNILYVYIKLYTIFSQASLQKHVLK